MRSLPILLLATILSPGALRGQQEPVRDVLATAFRYPFLTDAEILGRTSDTEGTIATTGGRVLLRSPGIRRVLADGKPVPGHLAGADLWLGELPAGTHAVRIIEEGSLPPALPCPAPADAVATAAAFQERAGRLRPGDELVVADGHCAGWRLHVEASGTAEAPIVIRPATPGGVTFRRDSSIQVSGRFVVVRGFRFDQCGPQIAVHLTSAQDCRVTQCQFFGCGSPTSTFAHIVRIDTGCHRNRVDHCYFTGSKSMSLGQRIVAGSEVGTHNRFDHNVFRDIYRYWINGQENIQIGQNQRGASGASQSFCTVEGNLFDHAWGDGEICSNKSSRNRFLHNLACHCPRSAFTLRGGDGVLFEGNVMVNNGDGIRVMGQRHTIINNLILDQQGYGIHFETGHLDGESNVASVESLVAHNTIADCLGGAISAVATNPTRPHAPDRNEFRNNLFVGSSGTLLDSQNMTNSVVLRNLYHATGTAVPGDLGQEPLVADPMLAGEGPRLAPGPGSPALAAGAALAAVRQDRWGIPRPDGQAPTIGADEPSSGSSPRPVLPALPPRPVIAPELHGGRALFRQEEAHPGEGWRIDGRSETGGALLLDNATAHLVTELPPDIMLQWEYRPASFSSVASLVFAADGNGRGYTLEWGGLAKDGKPASTIRLRRSGQDQPVADTADVLGYYQNYRFQRWLNRTIDERESPDPALWYRFTLLRRGGRIALLLGATRSTANAGFPVLIWEDPAPLPHGPRLRLVQHGEGHWRRFGAREYHYTGGTPPPMPGDLRAEAVAGSRVDLRWEGGTGAFGCSYAIHRSEDPAVAPHAETEVAVTTGRTSWHDFDVQPQRSYTYHVVARNALGLHSPPASAVVTTGTGGSLYRQLPARAARLLGPPLTMPATQHLGRDYLWAPPGTPSALKDAPAEGGAVFRFHVDEAGTHALWGLVHSPTNGSDSFHVALDADAGGAFRVWSTGIHPAWGWSRILPAGRLAPGEHALTIRHREAATRLAAILVTNDTELQP